jgi:hypothetical protein
MAAVYVVSFCGCNSVYMPSVDPNKSDLTAEQTAALSKTKFKVPCRVEVHCPDSLTGNGPNVFSEDTYHYPLQEILRNSFSSASGKIFESPRNEVIDAFTVYVTVPESQLVVSGGVAQYTLDVIVVLKEPGEKKIDAFELKKTIELPHENKKEVPASIYKAAQEVAFESAKKLSENPKVMKTVKRFEDR